MSAYLSSIAGTEAGATLAVILALIAAIAHAGFGALQKGRFDPWLARASIDISYALIATPFVFFVVPWPESHMWPIFAGMVVIHVIYKYLMANAYVFGAYTVVYPIVRGTGPLVTVILAIIFFHEHYNFSQWIGVACLSGGIFMLARRNLRRVDIDVHTLHKAIAFALLCGVSAAAYTGYDAYGIRATADPFTFLAWFFFLDGLSFPILSFPKWRENLKTAPLKLLAFRGVFGGVIGIISFGCVMVATRIDKVGEAAVIRETSVVFAGIIGWLFLHEKVGLARAVCLCVIAIGAILVEWGGK